MRTTSRRLALALALAPLLAGCGSTTDASTQSSTATGSTSTGGGGAGRGGAGGAGQGGGGARPIECTGEKPVAAAGKDDTGYRACENGVMHRPTAQTCGSLVPRAEACKVPVGPQQGDCATDADCAGTPNGHCDPEYVGQGAYKCACQPGCTKDADCAGTGEICLCGDPIGACVKAACATDADCGSDYCRSFAEGLSCPGGTAFKCESPTDGCVTNASCGGNEVCSIHPDGVARCTGICMD